MSQHLSSLIIIHFLTDAHAFNFNDSLVNQMKEVIGSETNIFEMDNFSDAVTLSYASDLVKSEKLTILLTGEESATLGKASTILNQTIRHQNLKLLALNDLQAAMPFMIRMKGKIINRNELNKEIEKD